MFSTIESRTTFPNLLLYVKGIYICPVCLFVCVWRSQAKNRFKDPGTALMETKPIQVYTNENRL